MAIVNVKKLDSRAKLPVYSVKDSAGLDISALEDFVIEPGKMVPIRTGLAVQVPKGYEGQIRPRSGLALNNYLTILNSPGTIDYGYTGEMIMMVINHGTMPYRGKAGERIAQMVVKKVETHEVIEVADFVFDEINERKDSGFGSSGK